MNAHRLMIASIVAWLAIVGRGEAGIVAHWTFDEPSGASQLLDSVGTNHSTSIVTSTAGAIGQIGGAWQLNNTTDFITIDPSSGDLTGLGVHLTIAGWVKSTDNLGTILSISDNTVGSEEAALRVSDFDTPDGRADMLARPGLNTGEAFSTTFVNDAAWHHAVFAQDQTGWSLYVDGAEEDSGLAVDGLADPVGIAANVVNIGANHDNKVSTEWRYGGLLDDIQVYDLRLTGAQVSRIYQAGLTGRSHVAVPEPHAWTIALVGISAVAVLRRYAANSSRRCGS